MDDKILFVDDDHAKTTLYKSTLEELYGITNIVICNTLDSAKDLVDHPFTHVYCDYHLDGNKKGDEFTKLYSLKHPSAKVYNYTSDFLGEINNPDLGLHSVESLPFLFRTNHYKNGSSIKHDKVIPEINKRLNKVESEIFDIREWQTCQKSNIAELMDICKADHMVIKELVQFNESIKPIAKMNVKLAWGVICTVLLVGSIVFGGYWKFFTWYDDNQEKRFKALQEQIQESK